MFYWISCAFLNDVIAKEKQYFKCISYSKTKITNCANNFLYSCASCISKCSN